MLGINDYCTYIQGPFTSNSKTFKDLFHFQGLSPWANEHFFKDFQGLVATLFTESAYI